jgi:hypothetical protein
MTQNLLPVMENVVPVEQGLVQERWQDKTAKLSLKFDDNVLRDRPPARQPAADR